MNSTANGLDTLLRALFCWYSIGLFIDLQDGDKMFL
jgi:hypothetical protein